MKNKSREAFFALVRAGLWENTQKFRVECLEFRENIDWGEVYRLAREQLVVGLVLAGIERIRNANVNDNANDNLNDNENDKVEVDQRVLLQMIGDVQMMEQQNKTMNRFIALLIERMRKSGIYTLLVKGQGIAQCYERPLWRASGDVDLYLNEENYIKARSLLTPVASYIDDENEKMMHLGMTIKSWVVELHGAMYTELSRRINEGLDDVHRCIFNRGEVRSWNNNGVPVFLPSPDNDVIIVFTHIIQHFFIEGIGLKQICDWCRLLWTYKDSLDYGLLESRIKEMGLMRVWRTFGVFAVEYLGMPVEAMPMVNDNHNVNDNGDDNEKFGWGDRWRAKRVLDRVLKSGNFGHNNDLSYRDKYSGMTYKIVALYRRLMEFISLSFIFPIDAPRFFLYYLRGKV